MYAHMKNLSAPLPNVTTTTSRTPLLSMPEPSGWSASQRRDDDQESEICSVIADIPPPPAQVKSHALLQEGMLHPFAATATPTLQQAFIFVHTTFLVSRKQMLTFFEVISNALKKKCHETS